MTNRIIFNPPYGIIYIVLEKCVGKWPSEYSTKSRINHQKFWHIYYD